MAGVGEQGGLLTGAGSGVGRGLLAGLQNLAVVAPAVRELAALVLAGVSEGPSVVKRRGGALPSDRAHQPDLVSWRAVLSGWCLAG